MNAKKKKKKHEGQETLKQDLNPKDISNKLTFKTSSTWWSMQKQFSSNQLKRKETDFRKGTMQR